MAQYVIDEVRIEGNYPVDSILSLNMDIGVNKHGTFSYGGYVSEEAAKRCIQQKAEGQTVSVYLRDEIEFCGHIQKLTAKHENDYWYVEVELVTSTQLTDIGKHDRFFQDCGRTYEDIIKEAYDDSKLGEVIVACDDNAIGVPILQYRETDWEYTMRMAGRLSTVIIPNVTSPEPQILLGVPKRPTVEEPNTIRYKIGRSGNCLRYEMKSDNRYKLGDSVSIKGRTFVVMQKKLAYKRGQLEEYYVFGEEAEFAVPFYYNKKIAGLELEGTVLERTGQKLQMLLDIDSERKQHNKSWFCYSPVTNNGMYSMPLEGEKVMLKWQSERDEDVLVVRPARKNSSDMPHHSERHFLDENGNHLKMLPDLLEYINPVGHVTWFPDIGFDIATSKAVSIYAGVDVDINSRAQVRIYSPERITMTKTGVESGIDMISNEMHIKGLTNADLASDVNQHSRATLPNKPESFAITERTEKILASIPKVSL